MICPRCHTENRENARFCKGCGMAFTPEQVGVQAHPEEVQQVQDQSAEQPPLAVSSQEVQASSQEQERTIESQEGSVEVTVVDQPVAAVSSVAAGDDISQAPTQILSQEELQAYRARFRPHDHEDQDISQMKTVLFSTPVPSPSGQAAHTPQDVADAPTIVAPPAAVDDEQEMPTQISIADQPTIITQVAQEQESSHVESTPVVESGADASNQPAEQDQSEPTAATISDEQQVETVAPEGEQQEQPAEEKVVSGEENHVEEEQTTQATQDQPATAQEVEQSSFPLLAVGTLVGGRYEIVQTVGEESDRHVYQVIDRQGYQHCWNCGSEENSEGDEFCIDCGAELLNASYILYEYPAAPTQDREANVLQGSIVNTLVDGPYTYVVEQPQVTQMAFPNGVHLLAAGDSDAGDIRRGEPNEDSVLVLHQQRVHESLSTPAGVYVVADGMGGHANGQGASRLVIGIIAERVMRELVMQPLSNEKEFKETAAQDEDALVTLLQGAVQDANNALCQLNQRERSDSGSTLTGFMIVNDFAYIVNVGDSRTYMQRDGKLYQLTNDHSLVGQMVAGGLIEPDDIYTHPQRSQIYRSLGDKPNVQIDIFKQQVHPGDILLSCSDGLWEMIRNPQISEILSNAPDPQTACTRLIEAANANGGEDNVSAVVVYVR